MHHQFLRIVALLFIALVILQSLLGTVVFTTTVGWTPNVINDYYAQRSFHGLLETLIPHTLFITIALMGTLHFLGFVDTIDEIHKGRFIHLLFTLFLIDQTSPILINLGMASFAYIKIATYVGFQIALIVLWHILFRSVIKTID